jgi:hypothetical protein
MPSRPRTPGQTTTDGYGWDHQQKRAAIAPRVNAGLVNCWRCGRPITPGTPWHLGHDDHDRTIYRGPEHQHCNTSAAATLGNRARRTRRPATPRFDNARNW